MEKVVGSVDNSLVLSFFSLIFVCSNKKIYGFTSIFMFFDAVPNENLSYFLDYSTLGCNVFYLSGGDTASTWEVKQEEHTGAHKDLVKKVQTFIC